MQKPIPEDQDERETQQQTAKAGHDVTIVGHDYRRTTNFNFVIFLAGVLALGGLAWAIYMAGFMPKPGGNQQNQTSPETIQRQVP